ncbi:MAG TPA: SIMPL domain-containing protein [Pyrinomonadaceae bacterium]|nr:SIMPL domain-containing protein [Pyrinomonadaceae bacterium]
MLNGKNGNVFNAGFWLAVGLVLSSTILAWAHTRTKSVDQTITVTGSARKRITSDLIVWRANVSYQSGELSEAYGSLKDRVPRVKAYLVSKGVPEEQIVVSSVSTKTMQEKDSNGEETGRVGGYVLTQTLEVRSHEVEKIARISREVTELIDQGILLESQSPEYHYTKLGDLKVQMLGEAAQDAKVRAERIASSTGSDVGSVRSARMGVMQITPADSNEVSDYGVNDTSSLDKDITAVVNVSFAVD